MILNHRLPPTVMLSVLPVTEGGGAWLSGRSTDASTCMEIPCSSSVNFPLPREHPVPPPPPLLPRSDLPFPRPCPPSLSYSPQTCLPRHTGSAV